MSAERARPSPLPPATECGNCGAFYAEVVCHLCKTPRRAFLQLLAALRRAPIKRAA